MPGRPIPLITGEYYHLINRGADNRAIFLQQHDFKRFMNTIYYYQYAGPKPKFSKFSSGNLISWKPNEEMKIVDIIAFCLMTNHFHLLIQQLKDGGASKFMSQVLNSYTKNFNTKYKRKGALFQGAFNAVLIENDNQLLHVSRYIHINSVAAGIVQDICDYKWSSHHEYMGLIKGFCSKEKILGYFKSSESYDKFLHDQIEYGQSLEMIKRHLVDEL
ncbi:MAG: transposase [Candidatus Blackburnbacteria bacterium]|nr:transposase [Candidatus Blackburnbacteria bacterium]